MTTMSSANRREVITRGIAGLGAAVAATEILFPAAGDPLRRDGAARPAEPLLTAAEDAAASGGAAGSESLLAPRPDHQAPATFDRLDPSWYRATIRRLQERMREEGIDAVLLADRWNIIYFTGLWHTTTERPFAILIPARGLDLTWFAPGLDRDLVSSWWIEDQEFYFDFKHARGGFPHEGKVLEGNPVDLTRWIWKGLRKRGYADKVVGLDRTYDDKARSTVADVAPKALLKRVEEMCLKMRMVKTPEEIALAQRALDYWSRMHAFARDLILKEGTDAVDYEIAQATMAYGARIIMNDIERDGRPHNSVGISIRVGCRSGVGTAFPHPNQFHYNKVEKGHALQVAGIVNVGGCGGELYRGYQIHPWDAHREKVWDVHTESCRIQQRESRAGVVCSHVAKAVHDYQVEHGMQDYIYHRPAHGQGSEGHQAPYIALGDVTTLEEGMMFSNEPGLYDAENGFGYNHSDNVLVTAEGGIPMGSVPMSKEWCFLRL
jgi:Xaa-Pro aminopeptidase